MKKNYLRSYILLIAIFLSGNLSAQPTPFSVLVFSKTTGFRHGSITQGQSALLDMASDKGFGISFTEDAGEFTFQNLSNYQVVIFLNTTGDVLNEGQQNALQSWYREGGGFVGIHSAADTEYDWPWYNQLLGAWFNGHPQIQPAESEVVDTTHISIQHLARRWRRTDEWYNYRDIQDHINVLLNLDESTYQGGTNGSNHPISWYHEFEGGRTFYTGMGHTAASYSEADFLDHLWGGIQYVAEPIAGEDDPRVKPNEEDFSRTNLVSGLNEPMELAALPDGNVLFVERRGNLKRYNFATQSTDIVGTIPVYSEQEDGLLGLALDPNFAQNNQIYLMYSPPGAEAKQHVSRFTFGNATLDLSSEEIILEIPTQRDQCCHSGGSLEFDAAGNLYISTGDDTNPFESDGYAPIDERSGRSAWDAQRTSANTQDLRGKILRITPQMDGTYSIPEGNLFADSTVGRPEIYVMGCRNPFRISIDQQTGYLYWGDVGPDAGISSNLRGPMGLDEVNQAREAGFFGWPYFIGANEAYRDYEFATSTFGQLFDVQNPQNTSVNNTGSQSLPPAQEALIWYPYSSSSTFPLLGEGGRNAMAGPIYYSDDFLDAETRFPRYYDGKLFIYDWMRGWIMAVTLDENGDYYSMEPFLPNMTFTRPMDMVIGPDGDMFLLEYGSNWFTANADARLVHITYTQSTVSVQSELAQELRLKIYPLPAQEVLNIQAKEPIQVLELFSLDGKLILRKEVGKDFIQLRGDQFSQGLYFLKLQFAKGQVMEKVLWEK